MRRLAPALLLFAAAGPALAQKDDAAKALDGKYALKSMTVAGKALTKPEAERESFLVQNGQLIAVSPDGKTQDPIAFKITGANIDFVDPKRPGGPHMVGVYKLDGNTLTLCFAESDKAADRPKDVAATGDRIVLMVLEKAEPKKVPPKK